MRRHSNKPGDGTGDEHREMAEYPENRQLVHGQMGSAHVGDFQGHVQTQHFNMGMLPGDQQKRQHLI